MTIARLFPSSLGRRGTPEAGGGGGLRTTPPASQAPLLKKGGEVFCLALLLALGTGAFAQYPAKPIRLVVPFPAGESVDATARLVAQSWSTALGQQILVDNRGGAGGTIGSEAVAKSAPDGYTILWGNVGPLAIGPGLYKQLGYEVARDFEPVSLVAILPFVLFASPVLPANSVVELLAYARAHPGELNFGSTGVGSGLHLIGELFKSEAGIQIVHVPYKGVGQGADRLQYHSRVPAAREIRAPEGARDHLDLALAAAARRPDDARSGAPRRARRVLACRGRARRHNSRDHRTTQPDARRNDRRTGDAQYSHRPGRAAGRKLSGGVADVHAGGSGEVGPRDSVIRRARGLSAARIFAAS